MDMMDTRKRVIVPPHRPIFLKHHGSANEPAPTIALDIYIINKNNNNDKLICYDMIWDCPFMEEGALLTLKKVWTALEGRIKFIYGEEGDDSYLSRR